MKKYLDRFGDWFNIKFGWFFTNGMKDGYMSEDSETLINEMKIVDASLQLSREFGLETEVLTWALGYMKNDPSLTISDAIDLACREWVK